MIEINIREMLLEDIKGVLEVEKASYQTPWTEDIFEQELRHNRYAHYYVVESDNQIIGYAGMWLVIDEAQITNIAIVPRYRGKRVGEQLFAHMLSIAIRIGAIHLSLEVRESNTIAQKMYQKFGLVPGGIRKNYYTDNQEDAIVMWVKFNETR